jgi:hypothetical protein
VKVSRRSALRASCAVLLTLAAAAAAAPNAVGPVASLTDLRVGVHPDHTRIVIETDAQAPYVLDPSEREILVHVDAASTAEAVTARSPHLVLVKVEPTALGTDVRIQLKQAVEVRPLVLEHPDRIVLDLYPKAKAPAPLPAPEVLPEEEAAPPPVVAVVPEPAPAVEPGPAPEPEMAPEEEPGLPIEPEGEPPLVLELPEGEEAPEIPAELETPPVEVEPEEMAPEAAPPPEVSGGGVESSEPTESASEPMTPSLPTVPALPAPSGSRFGSPFALGATALVLLALFVWLRRRLRAGEGRRLPPLPEEDREPYEPPSRAVPVDDTDGGGESVFDVEPDALAAHEEVPSLRTPVASGLDSEDENERRIAHLEKRMEELGEAKDRLERQIAAQTEELRVQRAAIARTQRVLRSIAPRGEDEPSEPVSRG